MHGQILDYLGALPTSQPSDGERLITCVESVKEAPVQILERGMTGFCRYHYGFGREGDWLLMGISARKINLEFTSRLARHDILNYRCVHCMKELSVN